jgi:hypothetical protein
MSDDEQGRRDVGAARARATSPVAGAVAGMLFALLFSASLVIIGTTITALPRDTGAWLASGASTFRFAIGLIPFAGLFFLWFIAVARQRLGSLEDQFFGTVFLGSGLLFLALVFCAAASAGAIIASFAANPTGFAGSSTYLYARNVYSEIFFVYALRMAGVFQISGATLWIRTGVMPRWVAFITYAAAAVLLFTVTTSIWIVLLFPAWVFFVSVYILATHLRTRRAHGQAGHDGMPTGT